MIKQLQIQANQLTVCRKESNKNGSFFAPVCSNFKILNQTGFLRRNAPSPARPIPRSAIDPGSGTTEP